jgi:putative methyltransferase (TIGR04325 family)
MKLRDFVPPIVYQLKNSLVQRGKVTDVHFPVYSSYHEAEIACGDLGYEQEELVDVVFQKTMIFREQLFTQGELILTEAYAQSMIGLLYTLNFRKIQAVNVLDFGGACGAHYFFMRAALGKETRLNWHVVETPAMAGKAKIFETDELRFFYDITTARKAFPADVDYFHSSGTIQYTPNPENTLKEIFASQAKYIMLNRLALSSGKKEIITIQESMLSENGSGPLPVGVQDKLCRYPVVYYPKQKLEELLREKYSIILRFGELTADIIKDQKIITAACFAERLQ